MANKSLFLGGILLFFGLSLAGCGDDNNTPELKQGTLSITPDSLVMKYEQSPKSIKLTYLGDNNEPLAGAKVSVTSDPYNIVMDKEKGFLLDENGQVTINISNLTDTQSVNNDNIIFHATFETSDMYWDNSVTLKVDYLSGQLVFISETVSEDESNYGEYNHDSFDFSWGNTHVGTLSKYLDSPKEDKLLLSLHDATNNKDVEDYLQGKTVDFQIDDNRCYLTTADNVKTQKGQITLNQHSSAVVPIGYTSNEDFTCTYHFSYTLDTASGTKAEYDLKLVSHAENMPVN